MRNFRDFPKALDKITHLKNEKIVAYCTGGIRCEKASAYMKQAGFKQVFQLKGGILAYGKEFPDTFWEGHCFVFDDRLSIRINTNDDEEYMKCQLCKSCQGVYVNCHNIHCDKLFIACEECLEGHNASCSGQCATSKERRKKGIAPGGVR
jgi:UPF0176 protein